MEIVRRVFEAVARHDPEAVLAVYDRNVEYDFSGSPLRSFVGDRVYRGHDGIRKMIRDRHEAWEAVDDDCQELIDAGERVISFVVSRARGRSSGIDTDLRHYGVWTIRKGKITRVAWVHTREEALEAAGLSE